MLLSCLRGLDVAYILSVCKGKAFDWFPQVFWLFSLQKRRFMCFGADLDGFLSQMMCTLELFVPQSALRCEARCSVLRWPLQCAAEAGAAHCVIHSLCCSEGLPADFYAVFPRLRLCFLRAWAGCERGWVPPAGGLRGGGLRSARPENVKREGCRDDIPSRLLLYLVWLACLCARRFGWSISPSKVSPNARVRL